MMISGNVTVRNGIELDYPFVQCIESLLPVCEMVQVCDSDSTDGTRDVLDSMARKNHKIRILNYPWKNPSGDIDVCLDWMNFSRETLPPGYHLHLEADEILGSESYPHLLRASTIPCDCTDGKVIGFTRLNFWLDANHVLKPGHILSPLVIRFAPKWYFLGGDAPHRKATQTEPNADWSFAQKCFIYHYGFLRKQESYLKKQGIFMQAFFGNARQDERFSASLENSVSNGTNWMEDYPVPHKPFTGEHPASMVGWLKERHRL
jgi:hypothetical protein